MAVLSGLLSGGGIEHYCLDGNFYDAGFNCLDDEEGFIRGFFSGLMSGSPDMICISTWGVTLPFTLLLIRLIKDEDPGIPVLIGGIKSRLEAAETIGALAADGLCLEGIVLGECDSLLIELVTGIYDLKRGTRQSLPDKLSSYTEIIDGTAVFSFPQDDCSLWGLASYENFKCSVGRKFFFEGSRGCTNSCVFCSARSGPYRRKTPESLIEEIKGMKQRHAPLFLNFADNIFPLSGSWIRRFSESYINEDIGIEWAALARTDRIDPEVLSLMKDSGCINLFLGVESPNPSTLKYMNKAHDIDQYVSGLWDNLNKILDSGISIIASTIIGFPDESEEDMMNTVRFVQQCREAGIRAYSGPLVIYPGSALWDEHEAGKIELFKLRDMRLRRNHPGLGATYFGDNPVFVSNNFLPVNNTMSPARFESALLRCFDELEE